MGIFRAHGSIFLIPAQCRKKGGRRRIPLLRIHSHAALRNPSQAPLCHLLIWEMSRQHLVYDNPDRIDVRADIRCTETVLLRCGISVGTDELRIPGSLPVILGGVHVQKPELSFRGNYNVRRFDVPVNNRRNCGVQLAENPAQVRGQTICLLFRKYSPLLQHLPERLTADVFFNQGQPVRTLHGLINHRRAGYMVFSEIPEHCRIIHRKHLFYVYSAALSMLHQAYPVLPIQHRDFPVIGKAAFFLKCHSYLSVPRKESRK